MVFTTFLLGHVSRFGFLLCILQKLNILLLQQVSAIISVPGKKTTKDL